MIDLLLTHATVITMNPARTILEDGAVAVDGGRIVAVGPTAEVATHHQATKSIDCRHRVLMPGLVTRASAVNSPFRSSFELHRNE
jgi:predicted amidohydrolase YtcJ